LYVVVEGFSELSDVESYISFFNETVGPDSLKKKFLSEYAAGVLNEHQKEIKHLRRDGDVLAISGKDVILGVKTELTKTVKALFAQLLHLLITL
jgi:hypothetical protein